MKKLSKNYLRKIMFSFFEFLPSFLAKPAARLLVYTQHRVFIEELQAISKDFPCIQENDAKTWQRILVIRLDSIGDITWTTAFFRELRPSAVLYRPPQTFSTLPRASTFPANAANKRNCISFFACGLLS